MNKIFSIALISLFLFTLPNLAESITQLKFSQLPVTTFNSATDKVVGTRSPYTTDYQMTLGSAASASASSFLLSASNLSDIPSKIVARSNLGLVIGTNVQAWSAILDTIVAGGTVPISLGGTGATTAHNALVSLGITSINLASAGLPTGGDDTTAINALAVTAKSIGLDIDAPCGTYNHAGLIIFDSINVTGHGACTIFRSTDATSPNPQHAVEITGSSPSIYNFSTSTSWAGTRQQNNESSDIYVLNATNFKVRKITMNGGSSGGVFMTQSSGGEVSGNILSNTLADAYHITGYSDHINEFGNSATNSGDDCYAVVSYVSQGAQAHDIAIHDNFCDGGLARGVTVVGGRSVDIGGNIINNVIGSAFYVSSEGSYNTYGSDTVNIHDNIVHGAGEVTPSFLASIFIYGRSGYPVTNIKVKNNILDGLRNTGIQVGSASNYTSNVEISGNSFSGVGGSTSGYGIYLYGVSDIDINHNKINDFAKDGIIAGATINGGYAYIDHNNIKEVNTSASGAVRAISFYNSGFVAPFITNNTQQNGSTTLAQFINTGSGESGAVIKDNYGENTTLQIGATPVSNIMGNLNIYGVVSGGVKFTMSGCAATAPVGGAIAGTFTSGTTGTCTNVITMNGSQGMTAANGWDCSASDRTTPANKISTTASTTTTATLSGTTISGDVISFNCMGY